VYDFKELGDLEGLLARGSPSRTDDDQGVPERVLPLQEWERIKVLNFASRFRSDTCDSTSFRCHFVSLPVTSFKLWARAFTDFG
jgi:hypothetical protein